MNKRDLALVVLATIVAVVAMVCATTLAIYERISGDLVIGVLTGAGVALAANAVGRLSGANADQAPAPLPRRDA